MQLQDPTSHFLTPLPEWPSYGLSDNLLPILKKWHNDNRKIAIATLIHIQGSAPRPLGSEMIINDQGNAYGYISGGCVEAAITAEARAVLKNNQPRLLDYGAGSPVLDIALNCGGRIKIFLRPLRNIHHYLQIREEVISKREAIALKICLATGAFTPLYGKDIYQASTPNFFILPYLPPIKLFLTGQDPITLTLISLAPSFDIIPLLLRPLGPLHPPPLLPASSYDRRPLHKILQTLTLDAYCAFYCLSHNLEEDCQFAAHILKMPAFSVGILGSTKKKADIIAKLKEDTSLKEYHLQKLSLPAGLTINSKTPAEIALSILAEISLKRPRILPHYQSSKTD